MVCDVVGEAVRDDDGHKFISLLKNAQSRNEGHWTYRSLVFMKIFNVGFMQSLNLFWGGFPLCQFRNLLEFSSFMAPGYCGNPWQETCCSRFWGTSEAAIVFCWDQKVCTGFEGLLQLTHSIIIYLLVHLVVVGSRDQSSSIVSRISHFNFLNLGPASWEREPYCAGRDFPCLGQWELDSSLIPFGGCSSLNSCQFCSKHVSLFPYELPALRGNNSHIKVIFSPITVLEKNLYNKSDIFIHM